MYNNFRKNITNKQRAYKEWRIKRLISKEHYTLEVRKYMDTMGLIKCQAESDFIKELKQIVKTFQPFTYKINLERCVTMQEQQSAD